MRNIGRNILCSLLLVLYLIASVGIGVHTCSSDGTRDFVALIGDVSCDAIHSHHHCHHLECGDEGECHHEHNGNCCHTTVFVLTDDRNVSDSGDDIQGPPVSQTLFQTASLSDPVLYSQAHFFKEIVLPSPGGTLSGNFAVRRL